MQEEGSFLWIIKLLVMKVFHSPLDRLRFLMMLMVILGGMGLVLSIQPYFSTPEIDTVPNTTLHINPADTQLNHLPQRQQLNPKQIDTAMLSVPSM